MIKKFLVMLAGAAMVISMIPATGTPSISAAAANPGCQSVNRTDGSSEKSSDVLLKPAMLDRLNVYAAYQANSIPNASSYTVHFDANDGIGNMADESFTIGTAQALTANTYTKQGWLFAGWNTSTDGSGTFYADAASVNIPSAKKDDTVTLYAQWSQSSFKLVNLKTELSNIIFYSELGTNDTGKSCAKSTSENLTAVPAAKSVNDYEINWTHTNQDNPSLVLDHVSIDTTAKQVTFNYSEAMYNNNPSTHVDGDDWYLSAVIVKNGNITYYGKIKALVNKTDASGNAAINIPADVTLHPYDGSTMYVFTENLSSNDPKQDVGGPLIAIGPYSVSYCDKDGEETKWNTTPANYRSSGSIFHVGGDFSVSHSVGTNGEHYYLRGWTLDKYGTTRVIKDGAEYTMPEQDITFYAVWGSDYTASITYKSSNESMGTVSSAAESDLWSYAGAAKGSTATAKSGCHFVNWTDQNGREVSTKAEYTPDQTSDTEGCYYYADNIYTANFAADSVYPVSPSDTYNMVKASPSDGGTVTGNGSYQAGTTAVLKAVPNTGYKFSGWYTSGKLLSTEPVLTVNVSKDMTVSAHFSTIASSRIFGKNRYDTMAEAVEKAFPNGCDTAILASGTSWQDALTASSLAGVKECPVILTAPGKLTSQTADVLSFLKAKTVIIIGGTSSISDKVKADIESKGIKTERIGGSSPIKTANKIEAEVMKSSKTDTVIICSGQDFPDAISISSYAYEQQTPILLTGKDKKLSSKSLAIAKTFQKAIILGNKNSVSGKVEKQLSSLKVTRYGGDNRYAASVKIIKGLYGNYIPTLVIVTGRNYPNALAAAALAGKTNGAVLLVNGKGTALTAGQKTVISNAGDTIILGSDKSITSAMKKAVDSAH